MESSRINYPKEVEETINNMLEAYVDAELAYSQAAANAYSETVYLKNFARYFEARARELNYFRSQMMRYQTERGGQVAISAQRNTQYPFRTVKSVKEMNQVMRQFVEIERDLQEMWEKFYELTTSMKDVMSAHYAEHYLMQHQSRQYAKMVRFMNSLEQSACVYFFDNSMMREEADEKEEEDECDFFEQATEQN
ncbi:unnamed protein product [Schistocephalus solidus]|uniref:Ferritin n=1 Tax=Schistocephalus solidus TaxID=70667 RepID=A0A0V0J6B4_SCHSO|nr:unnamed protein product [Schistocephalus solidus]